MKTLVESTLSRKNLVNGIENALTENIFNKVLCYVLFNKLNFARFNWVEQSIFEQFFNHWTKIFKKIVFNKIFLSSINLEFHKHT